MLNPAPGIVVGGRYLLVRPLAKGGMGAVWIARHRDLDVDVTVKFMEPSLLANADLRARFEREAKVAARLRSQHIVQVLDYGVDDGLPYIAMELLHGESLADRLARERRLSVGVTGHILRQICKALRLAHEQHLVHRDLKPGNIFLALEDKEEVVKVLDFGIVKEKDQADAKEAKVETGTGIAMGSVHYMSPEQIRSSRSVDARSDLWSVAVILYKMLTGDVPFPGTNHGDVMVRVCTDPFTIPSFVVPGLPKEMDAFFARALTRDPAGRYQSAEELAEAFAVVASLVSSVEPVQEGASRGWKKTIKLPRLPIESLPPVDTASGSVVHTQPFPQAHPAKEPSFVSAVLEKTGGTFPAVTTPRANGEATLSSTASPPDVPSRVPRGLVGAAVLAVIASAGLVGVVAPRLAAPPEKTISSSSNGIQEIVAAPVESIADKQAIGSPMVSAAPSQSALPSNSAHTQPHVPRRAPPKAPGTVTGTSTTTASPKPKVNPLDIAN